MVLVGIGRRWWTDYQPETTDVNTSETGFLSRIPWFQSHKQNVAQFRAVFHTNGNSRRSEWKRQSNVYLILFQENLKN